MAHPEFQVKTGKDKQFYFNLTAKNGQPILASEGYKAKDSCENGIASVKKNAPDDKRYERKVAKNGEHYFVLKAGNGEVIGKSEMYKSKDSMENGIKSVMTNAPIAGINHL
ncbi:MAG: YegP family protein [Tenuifilaceae bacterium]